MGKPDLTIGMAVYDDLDGLYFTVQGINIYHPEVRDKIEILVLDNNPDSEHGQAVADFLGWIKNARYFPYAEWKSTAVRDVLFAEAASDYVLCIDSHVLLLPGTIARLIDFYKQNVYCGDLLQGPMMYDSLDDLPPATHFDHEWRSHMLGVWGADPRGSDPDAPPFEIQMQGLGAFACRKDAWLGFNRLFRGFGGEEWYIHQKFRDAGKKAICLPFLRWTHRFRRPAGTRYRLQLEDRVYNYFVGHLELDADVTPIFEHFGKDLGPERCTELCEQAKKDLLLQPLRIRNLAPEIPIVTCLMLANNTSVMHLNEAVESFHRQYYQARELVIFNDGPNVIVCDHPLVKVINYPEGLSSIDECVKTALPACNGEIICLWDSHGIELPWRISSDLEMLGQDRDFWQTGNFWKGDADGMALRPSGLEEFSACNYTFRRSWLAENLLSDSRPVDHIEWAKMSTIVRDAQYAGGYEPAIIETGWRMNYATLASTVAVDLSNRAEQDRPLPTFLVVCDIVSWAQEAIENLNRIGGLEIILLDNGSTNPDMLQFLGDCSYEVVKLKKRLDQSKIWDTKIHRTTDGPFLAVHSFFDLSSLPASTPAALCGALNTLGVARCGVSVVFDDLPAHHPCRDDIAERETKHWKCRDGDYFVAEVGFAFWAGRSDKLSERSEGWYTPQRRLCPPYVVKYRPWYLDFDGVLPQDVAYYLEHAGASNVGAA